MLIGSKSFDLGKFLVEFSFGIDYTLLKEVALFYLEYDEFCWYESSISLRVYISKIWVDFFLVKGIKKCSFPNPLS